jgi:hypothetical protein
MAVRVKVEPVKYEVSCKCCKAVLEYIGSDIQYEEVQYQRDSETRKYIICPVCNRKVYVQSEDKAIEDSDSKTALEVLKTLSI